MGGRAAELIYFGDADGLSTGVASDLDWLSGELLAKNRLSRSDLERLLAMVARCWCRHSAGLLTATLRVL